MLVQLVDSAYLQCSMKQELELCKICTDSSAAKAFTSTRGLGRMRHVEVKLLWLQDLVYRKVIRVGKVSGTTNVADSLTKYHSAEVLFRLFKDHGVQAASTTRVVGPRGGVESKTPPQVHDVHTALSLLHQSI